MRLLVDATKQLLLANIRLANTSTEVFQNKGITRDIHFQKLLPNEGKLALVLALFLALFLAFTLAFVLALFLALSQANLTL